jgi:serine/alanine adding enzyme
MTLLVADEQDRVTWSKLTNQLHGATFFHQVDWINVLKETFHYDCDLILVKSNEEPIGTMGVFTLNSLRTRRMVSYPFSDFGGPLLKEGYEQQFTNDLVPNLESLARTKRAQYLLIKHVPENLIPSFERRGFTIISGLCYFSLDLIQPLDKIVGSFERRTRNAIHHAERRGLKFQIENLGKLDEFYRTYLGSMKRLGSPPQGMNFFRNVFSKFQSNDGLKLFSSEFEGRKVGFMLLLLHNRIVHYYVGVWGNEGLKVGAPSFLNYSTIAWARENGFEEYNFGRTTVDSGVYLYKRGYGGVIRPLNSMVKRFDKSTTYLNANSRKFRLVSKMISLSPMFVVRLVGPFIKNRLE